MKQQLPFDDKMIKDEIYRYIDDPDPSIMLHNRTFVYLKPSQSIYEKIQ